MIEHIEPGSIILQRDSPERHPLDLIIAMKSPHFAHCGIYVGQGRMLASALAFGGVAYQAVSQYDDMAVPVRWLAPVDACVLPWAREQLGKPYDLWAWVDCIVGWRQPIPSTTYDCSTFLGAALNRFAAYGAFRRQATPDDIARALGALP